MTDHERELGQIAPGLLADAPRRQQIIEAHTRAIEADQPGYFDPVSGLFVMTAAHHLARGSCCESGCRHCPFEQLPD